MNRCKLCLGSVFDSLKNFTYLTFFWPQPWEGILFLWCWFWCSVKETNELFLARLLIFSDWFLFFWKKLLKFMFLKVISFRFYDFDEKQMSIYEILRAATYFDNRMHHTSASGSSYASWNHVAIRILFNRRKSVNCISSIKSPLKSLSKFLLWT